MVLRITVWGDQAKELMRAAGLEMVGDATSYEAKVEAESISPLSYPSRL